MEKILLFEKWDLGEVSVNDPGLRGYINLKPVVMPHTSGRFTQSFLLKEKINIVERFANKLQIPGHQGKKHRIASGRCTANKYGIVKSVMEAFEIINKKTGKNPVQTLVQAIENSSTYEEIAAYRLGGIIARRAVVTAPARRLDVALRHLAQGIYRNTTKDKRTLAETIAEELLKAASGDKASFAVSERQRLEREAEGAR